MAEQPAVILGESDSEAGDPASAREPEVSPRRHLRQVAFGLAGVIAVWLGFMHFPAYDAGQWVRRVGYYTIALTFAWWCWCAVRVARSAPPPWSSAGWWRPLAGACALTLVAIATTPYAYKVLYDELVIQTTAMTMSQDRVVGAIGRAYELWGRLQISFDFVDKRPFFFPFLISLVHDLTGFREWNAFALNTVLAVVALLLAYACGSRIGGRVAGWMTMISLGAFSLVAINTTGAGLEMLNLALVLGLVFTGCLYLEKSDDGWRLSLLVLTAVLLANTRYESGVYIGTAALVVLEGWRRARGVVLPPAAIIAPLLLIPYAWHNTYLSGMPVLWELRAGQEARFSMEYFNFNVGMALKYFGNFSRSIANSPWLTWAGGLSLVGWLVCRARQRKRWGEISAMEWSATACGLGVAANMGLLLAYYWGDLSDPIVSRLSLPLHALLALLVGGAVAWLARTWRAVVFPLAAGGALIAYMVWGLPVNQSLNGYNMVERVQRWQLARVLERGPATRLIITDRSPLFWYVHGVSSTDPKRTSERLEGLRRHWRMRSFDEILVMQEMRPVNGGAGGFEPVPVARLPDVVKLETVAETRVGGRLHRISVIKEIEVDAGASPAPASGPVPAS